jgi:hypothetical protein
MAPVLENGLGEGAESAISAALHGPVLAQILLGAALIAVGAAILVIGRRRYRRRLEQRGSERETE